MPKSRPYPWTRGSVALVGSAKSLLDSSFGPAIDAHDWVIRINQGAFAALTTANTGVRTDVVLMTVTGGTIRHRLMFLIRVMRIVGWKVVLMSPKQRSLLGVDLAWFFPHYPEAWHRELTNALGSRPSTGAMGVDLLLRTMEDPTRLSLYGFDFFRTPDIAHGRNRVVAHSPEAEEHYIRGVIPPERFFESPIVTEN